MISVMATPEARLVALAHRQLPAEIAERWIALIRPAVRLRPCGPKEKLVGQLGGDPFLPDDVAWPVWEGEGSLNFVASIDCGQLPSDWLDIALPESGTLLFFYFDDTDGYFDPELPPRSVYPWDLESVTKGTRVLFVPAGVATAERAAPADITGPYDYVPLTAKAILTGPDWWHPAFQAACHDLSPADLAFLDDSANGDALTNATYRLAPEPRHLIGGHAYPVQNPVETEVARARLGAEGPLDDQTMAAVLDEAREWIPLVQIDSDHEAGMLWGDVGSLYWLIRPDDLAARNFEACSFTWQCS